MPTTIITGASAGIGRALALLMAEEGYDLGLMARRRELLESLQGDPTQKSPSLFSLDDEVCLPLVKTCARFDL